MATSCLTGLLSGALPARLRGEEPTSLWLEEPTSLWLNVERRAFHHRCPTGAKAERPEESW